MPAAEASGFRLRFFLCYQRCLPVPSGWTVENSARINGLRAAFHKYQLSQNLYLSTCCRNLLTRKKCRNAFIQNLRAGAGAYAANIRKGLIIQMPDDAHGPDFI